MKKISITESQLKGLIRKIIREDVEKETSSIATIVKYYNQSNNNKLKQKISNYGNSRLPENPNPKQLYDFLNQIGDKNKLEMIKKMLEKDIQNKSITESQLRKLVKKMIKEEMEMSQEPRQISPQEAEGLFNQGIVVYVKYANGPIEDANTFRLSNKTWDGSMNIYKMNLTPEQYGFKRIIKWLEERVDKPLEYYTLDSTENTSLDYLFGNY